MNNCVTCGRKIWLETARISVNRKRGVSHWLSNRDGDACPCLKNWIWVKMRADKSKPTVTEQKMAEWDAANPCAVNPSAEK